MTHVQQCHCSVTHNIRVQFWHITRTINMRPSTVLPPVCMNEIHLLPICINSNAHIFNIDMHLALFCLSLGLLVQVKRQSNRWYLCLFLKGLMYSDTCTCKNVFSFYSPHVKVTILPLLLKILIHALHLYIIMQFISGQCPLLLYQEGKQHTFTLHNIVFIVYILTKQI